MKKSTFLGFSMLAIMILLFSCQKYEQEYRFDKIEDIKIALPTANGRYTVVINDSLKISPIITEATPGSDDFDYEWRVLEQSTTKNWVISTSKNLAAKIEIPAAIYYMTFKMTNKRTQQFYLFQGMLTVTSPYNTGYYITSNIGTQGKLSFLRTSDDQLFHALPELVNTNKTYPGKALHADNLGGLLYYFTTEGIYRFTANDLVENGRNAEVIDGNKKFVGDRIGFAEGTSSWDAFMVGDAGVYVGFGSTSATFNGNGVLTTPYSARLVGDYSLYGGVFTTSSVSMFYDNKYKRFVQCPSQLRYLEVLPATKTAVFDMADVKMTMIAADAGQAANEYYYLMQNASGVRYFMSTVNLIPGEYKVMNSSPDINTATAIASSALVKHVYYASANKIYVYDILANSSRLVYTYPSGYVIKDMKMDRATSKTLIVGLSKSATEGEVNFFTLDNIGSVVNNTPAKTFTGFGDIASVNIR